MVHTLIRAAYNHKEKLEIECPDSQEWVEVYCQHGHYDNQNDYITVTKELSEWMKQSIFVSYYKFGDIYFVKLNSIDTDNTLNKISLEVFNERLNKDFAEYVGMCYDKYYRISYLIKLKQFNKWGELECDFLNYSVLSGQTNETIEINKGVHLNFIHENSYGSTYICRYSKSDKYKIFWNTLLSRYLAKLGVNFTNEYVDKNLDLDTAYNIGQKLPEINVETIVDQVVFNRPSSFEKMLKEIYNFLGLNE